MKDPISKVCHNSCKHVFEEYEACGKRIEADNDGGKAHCEPQFFEYLHCVDKCVCVYIFILLLSLYNQNY